MNRNPPPQNDIKAALPLFQYLGMMLARAAW